MFHELAREVSEGLGLVVIDEGWWQAGLSPHRELSLDGFAEEVMTGVDLLAAA